MKLQNEIKMALMTILWNLLQSINQSIFVYHNNKTMQFKQRINAEKNKCRHQIFARSKAMFVEFELLNSLGLIL